jgi:hypothetical protein
MTGATNKPKGSLLPFIVIFGGIGVVLLVIAFFLYTARQEFIGTAISAEGVVAGFEKRAGSSSSASRRTYVYAPIVRFTDSSGKQVTFAASAAGSGSDLQKNDVVEVLYNPVDSQDAKIATTFHLWAAPIVVGVIGVIFFGVGVLIVVVSVFENRRPTVKHSKDDQP